MERSVLEMTGCTSDTLGEKERMSRAKDVDYKGWKRRELKLEGLE